MGYQCRSGIGYRTERPNSNAVPPNHHRRRGGVVGRTIENRDGGAYAEGRVRECIVGGDCRGICRDLRGCTVGHWRMMPRPLLVMRRGEAILIMPVLVLLIAEVVGTSSLNGFVFVAFCSDKKTQYFACGNSHLFLCICPKSLNRESRNENGIEYDQFIFMPKLISHVVPSSDI